MSWIFLDVAAVESIHNRSILEFGGSPGLRDRGLLESAVLRAENKAAYDPDATTGSIAASLSFGLIKNHAFIDGNKRIGTAALLTFLGLNKAQLTASNEDLLATVLAVASSELSESAWVESHIAPSSLSGPYVAPPYRRLRLSLHSTVYPLSPAFNAPR